MRVGRDGSTASWVGMCGMTKNYITDWYVARSDKEASQTRDYCVAKNAPPFDKLRAGYTRGSPNPSRRKERLLRMTSN
jgi:hypothetical protein